MAAAGVGTSQRAWAGEVGTEQAGTQGALPSLDVK